MPDNNQNTLNDTSLTSKQGSNVKTEEGGDVRLVDILKGNIEANVPNLIPDEALQQIPEDIQFGYKLKNEKMRKFVELMKANYSYDDSELLKIVLFIDEQIEHGIINNEFLQTLRSNPEILKDRIEE